MSYKKISLSAFALILASTLGNVVSAQGFFKSPVALPGVLGSGSATPSASPQELSSQLGGLGKTFASAFQAMLMAESHTATALGLKSQAAKLEAGAHFFSSGTIDDYDQVKRNIELSSNSQAEIEKRMKGASTLDAKAKDELAKAAPFYAVGTVQAVGLPSQYASWVNRAQATMKGNPIAFASTGGMATQLPKVAQVTAQLPGLITKWGSLTKTFVTFSHKQKVDTGDLASKIGNL